MFLNLCSLAFVTLSNNLMVLAFRAMFAEFAILMSIAAFCFAGFLYCLWTLVPRLLLRLHRSLEFNRLSRGTFEYEA
jgi:hypothetical protein